MTTHAKKEVTFWIPIVSSIVGLLIVSATSYGGYVTLNNNMVKTMSQTDATTKKVDDLVSAPNGIIPKMQQDISHLQIDVEYIKEGIKDIKESIKK